ncbi:MAG: HAMP domain-containing sensor histidine kinase [Eubacteriales bacterium]|nr:HAMP domain-containing sensor histidine kinase [Eubacteriales bacterium]
MLKRLRIKFVCMLMTVITIMLCVVFGLVIHFTSLAIESQSIQVMRSISSNPFQLSMPEQKSGAGQVQLPFFAVQIGWRGDVELYGNSYYDLSDESAVLQITMLALGSEDQTGVLSDYGLRYLKTTVPAGQRIIFADMSSEKAAISNLIQSCALVGVFSLLVLFGISVLFARWAVKPVDQAWQQQKQFVADASHELKTPLAVIMTNAELLEYPDYDETMKAQFVQSILSMSHKMRELVESLLELARIDNGSVKENLERVDYSQLLTDEIQPFEALFFEKGRDLTISIEPGIHVHGSDKHLRQLLGILLDNSLKYSVGDGDVKVRLSRHGGHCTLAVANPGDEISREDLTNIFKRFYRVDKVRGMSGSYGLGLSIAQSIVNVHKGKIWAESQNGINTFFVSLPTIA